MCGLIRTLMPGGTSKFRRVMIDALREEVSSPSYAGLLSLLERYPVGNKDFSSAESPGRFPDPPIRLPNGYRLSSPQVKGQSREANHSLLV
jgi:hypothetical protein